VNTQKSVFDKLFLIAAWVFGFCGVGMLLLFQDFVALWLGAGSLLDFPVVLAIVLHFYVQGVHKPAHIYRTTLGYFRQGRVAPLLAAAVNVIVSIWLGIYFGAAGIFFATSIARFFTIGIVDPVLIYRNCFGKNPMRYYARYFAYLALFAALYFLCGWLIGLVTAGGVWGFALKCLIVTAGFNGAMLLVVGPTRNFRELWGMAAGLVKRK
jgi:hypothetical protein